MAMPPPAAEDGCAPRLERRAPCHGARPRFPLKRPLLRNRDPWPYVALAVVMLLVVGTRALQVRDLVVPAWVDSVHHTMITRLVAEGGRVPTTYRPYMPVDAFHYHFGFHAGAAALAWLSGLASDQAVLLFGQALNVLAPLAAYAMAWWIGRNRWGGVGAALVVGAVSYMPAYYVTWGRYTQLAGLDMFPPLALVTAWALGLRRGGARWGGMVLLAAALLAGLVLTHYRVLVFYAFLAIPQAAVILWRMARDPSPSPLPASGERASAPRMAPDSSSRLIASEARANTSPATPSSSSPLPIGGARADASPIGAGVMRALGRIIGRGALCGALALFLALPWVVGFLARVAPGFEATYGGWAGGEGGNEFPVALLNVGWTRPLLYVAAAGALWGLVRRRGEAIATAAWVGLCLLAANPRLLGLADTWLITNSAVVIAFWLPVGALCGWLVGDLGRLLARARLPRVGRVGGRVVSAVLLVAVVVLAAVGSWRMVDIVNPVTVLATEEDVSAMAWARDHTPPGALFLVNTGVWQGPMRYGTDAGWWLNLLADRSTTLPSLLYMMGGQAYFAEVNALGIAVEEAQSVDDPALLDRLRAAGVTHVFVGARGGRLLPRDLDPSPHYRALYTDGPIRIYEVVYP